MLAPANCYFLHQELCHFVCLQAHKKLHSAPLMKQDASKCIYIVYYSMDSRLYLLYHCGDKVSQAGFPKYNAIVLS